jgi:membrane-bound ClpP family serine protease
MEKGTLSRIIIALGLVALVVSFALVMYIASTAQGDAGNSGMSTPRGLPNSALYASFGGVATFVALFLIGARYAGSVYKDAVGKVFEITRLRSTYKGIARFQGINIAIQCTEQLAVGDRVKVTGTDASFAGNSRVMILLGTKLSPDNPEYSMADHDATMTPIV